jgi:protein-S-isoprenylcysteine O-methyltransferase Ste14
MHDQLIQFRPPRIAILLLVIAAAFHWLTPVRAFNLFSSATLSLGLASTGFVVMIVAWRQFKARAVAICPTATTERLITDGVYSFTRNPMYLGIALMLSGTAAWFGTLPFYAAALGFFVIMDRWFRRYEEEKLAAAFGREYIEYKSNVRPWI